MGVAAAGASWVAAARYYNDHYGRVTPGDRPRLRARRMAATGIYGVALIGGPFLDAQVQPSVSLFAALFAVAMLSWYKLCVQLRAHHIMVWGALLVAALVPVWGSLPDPISVAALPIGLAMIVTGVLDHRALVRGFGPARHADVADSYAGA